MHAHGRVEQLREVLENIYPWLQGSADDLVQRGDLGDARAELSEIQASLRDAAAADATFSEADAELSRIAALLSFEASDTAGAMDLLRHALQQFERLGSEVGVVAVHAEMSGVLWHTGDMAGATEHLDHAAERLEGSAVAQAQTGVVAQIFQKAAVLAEELYGEGQWELAARLAQHATVLAPEEPEGWRLLGHALGRLERYEGAARAYAHVADSMPEDASSRHNLAVALVNLDRRDDALRALDESLALAPREVRPLVLRGQLLAQAGRVDDAVADLETTLDVLEADRPVDDGTSEGTRRYREHWQMWLAAYSNLVEIHRQNGDRDALESTARRMIATGDDALSAMGHRLVGDLAREDGGLADARSAYDAAIDAFPLDSQARASRAAVATEMGDIDGAIRDLAVLAPREEAPRDAIEGLTALRARSDRPEILRWLGFAQFEIADFADAEASLDAYLRQVPGDVEARRWLGLSLISVTDLEDSRQGDLKRLFRGLEELARAATGGDAEGRDSMLWLLDRLMVVRDQFLMPIGMSDAIGQALPEVRPILDMLSRAQNLASKRDWTAGIEALNECIAAAEAAGLLCFATYQHAYLADQEFLRGDLDAAARHARQATGLRALAFTARTADLRDRFDTSPGIDPRAGDMGLEIEHLHVYGLLVPSLDDVERALARVLSRAGDRPGALKALGDVTEFVGRADRGSAIEAAAAAQTLRDVGLTDEALGVLERAECRAESDDVRASLLVGRATTLSSLGRLPEAMQALQKAEPLIDESRRWVVWLNVASYAQASGLNEEALTLLEGIDTDVAARSDEDRFGFQYLRAAALDGLGRGREAQDAALQAIGTLEKQRAALFDLTLRAAWTGKQEAAYALAVRIAAHNGDAALSFDLCERARSRQLVDEIAIGHSALDEAARALERRLRDAEDQRDVLAAIAGSGHRPRPELIIRLRELDPDLTLLEVGDDGIDRVSEETLTRARARIDGTIERLRQDIGERRSASAERLFGDVSDGREIRDLLRSFA